MAHGTDDGHTQEYGPMSIAPWSRSWRRLRRSTALAHLVGFSGANLVVGAICRWSLHDAGYSVAIALAVPAVILLMGFGPSVVMIGSRALAARIRRPGELL